MSPRERANADRRSGEDLDELRQALVEYVEAPDREASRSADQALHGAVAHATHNVYLEALSRQIRAQVSLGFQAEPYSDDLRRTALRQHAQLVEAIERRDGERAAALAREHFTLTETALRSLAERVGLGSAA